MTNREVATHVQYEEYSQWLGRAYLVAAKLAMTGVVIDPVTRKSLIDDVEELNSRHPFDSVQITVSGEGLVPMVDGPGSAYSGLTKVASKRGTFDGLMLGFYGDYAYENEVEIEQDEDDEEAIVVRPTIDQSYFHENFDNLPRLFMRLRLHQVEDEEIDIAGPCVSSNKTIYRALMDVARLTVDMFDDSNVPDFELDSEQQIKQVFNNLDKQFVAKFEDPLFLRLPKNTQLQILSDEVTSLNKIYGLDRFELELEPIANSENEVQPLLAYVPVVNNGQTHVDLIDMSHLGYIEATPLQLDVLPLILAGMDGGVDEEVFAAFDPPYGALLAVELCPIAADNLGLQGNIAWLPLGQEIEISAKKFLQI